MLNDHQIEFYGKMLAIYAIARIEGIERVTLRKYYDMYGDIYLAVNKCKEIREKLEATKIEYNGEMLAIYAIAQREGIGASSLRKYYDEYKDIYLAVNKCKEIRRKLEETKIEYNGEMLAMRTIAQRVGTTGDTLKRYYEQTGDIYEAIKQYYQKKDEYESGRIEYKGELKFLRTIAKDEGVAETTLRRYYKKYGNIDKAVYMAKIQRSRNQKVTIRNTELSLSDLSIVLGIKESELLNMLNSGMKIDDIKKLETEKPRKSPRSNKKLVLPNGQSLLEYCIENGLNFSCIYYSIHTYGKTMEEAIKHYREKGQEIPSSWIYEKYGILLKHLLLNNNINSQRVVSYMRKENISLNDALEEYVLRKNSKEANVDYDWMHELYSVLTDENMKDEYDAFKNTFYVTDQEEECIIKSYDEIENLQRKLLLYEIAEAFKANVFEETEKEELLKIYEVTEDEVETIFLDFYNYFENKIKLTEKEQRRKEEISDIAKKWYYLSGDERKDILDINNVTNYEQSVIEKLSQNITKYKNIINARGNKKMEGVSFILFSK